jgi:hypothetical protein
LCSPGSEGFPKQWSRKPHLYWLSRKPSPNLPGRAAPHWLFSKKSYAAAQSHGRIDLIAVCHPEFGHPNHHQHLFQVSIHRLHCQSSESTTIRHVWSSIIGGAVSITSVRPSPLIQQLVTSISYTTRLHPFESHSTSELCLRNEARQSSSQRRRISHQS